MLRMISEGWDLLTGHATPESSGLDWHDNILPVAALLLLMVVVFTLV